jgi:hypothetical protein
MTLDLKFLEGLNYVEDPYCHRRGKMKLGGNE